MIPGKDQLCVGAEPLDNGSVCGGKTVTALVTGNLYTLAAGQYTATFRTSEGARTFGINK